MARSHIGHGMFEAYKPDLPQDHPLKPAEAWAMFSRRISDHRDFYAVREEFAAGSTIIGIDVDRVIRYSHTRSTSADPVRGMQIYELREYPAEEAPWFLSKKFDPATGDLIDIPMVTPMRAGSPEERLLTALVTAGVVPPEKVEAVQAALLASPAPEFAPAPPPPPPAEWSQKPIGFLPPSETPPPEPETLAVEPPKSPPPSAPRPPLELLPMPETPPPLKLK